MMQQMKEHELRCASAIASKHVNVQYTLIAKAYCDRCNVLCSGVAAVIGCSGFAAAAVGCYVQTLLLLLQNIDQHQLASTAQSLNAARQAALAALRASAQSDSQAECDRRQVAFMKVCNNTKQ